MVALVTCKNEEDQIKNEDAGVLTRFSPTITLWQLSVSMETRVLIRSSPKSLASFSLSPMMLQLKFDCDQFTGWGNIPVIESVDGRTHVQTPARLVYYKLTL